MQKSQEIKKSVNLLRLIPILCVVLFTAFTSIQDVASPLFGLPVSRREEIGKELIREELEDIHFPLHRIPIQ